MDLQVTDEQAMLREAVRDVCARHASPAAVRALEDDPVGFGRELWDELGRMDLLGLTIPEEHGGAGQGALETALVYEELGRSLVPSPHFVSSVLAAGLFRAAGSEEQQGDWLPRIARGEAIVTVAWWEPDGGDGPDGVRLRAETVADGYRLRGTKILVPFASSATAVLTLARTGEAATDVGLLLVDPANVEATHTPTLATDASYRLRFADVVVPETARVGDEAGGWHALEAAMADGLIALAAFAIGGASRAHEMAVEYAKERVQFDRPIGSFQAIAHPLADMATEIEGGRVLVHQAAWRRDAGQVVGPSAAMAKLYAADVFRRTTKLGQQVFGGIGFTLDIDMQLYFRRAKQLELLWFGPRYLEEVVAAGELDAEVPFVSVDAGD